MLLGSAGCTHTTDEDDARLGAAIVGGQLDTTHKGVVAVLKSVRGGYLPACSGTLLAPNLVLTAHHCVAGLDSSDGATVHCGTTKFTATEPPSNLLVSVEANVGQEKLAPFEISQIWVPPGDDTVCGRDIALVLLSGGGVPASQATPIEPNLTDRLADNETFSAIGYGLQDPSDLAADTAGHRMSVTRAKVFCEGRACGSSMVAAGEFVAESPVCSGDSGGPALAQDGRVSGVTSRGDENCTAGIYTEVSEWKDFIIENALVAASNGGYPPPSWTGAPLAVDGVAGDGGASCGNSDGSSNASGSPGLAGSPNTPVGMGGSSDVSSGSEPLASSCSVKASNATSGRRTGWLGLLLLGSLATRRLSSKRRHFLGRSRVRSK